MHQHCCFAAINTDICNKSERQWDNTSYCNADSDQHKGPRQPRSKLRITVFQDWEWLFFVVFFYCRVQTNMIGPSWELPSICHSIGLEPSVESAGIFVNDEGWWMRTRVQWGGRTRGDGTFWSACEDVVFVGFSVIVCMCVCLCVCMHVDLRANVDDSVRGDW